MPASRPPHQQQSARTPRGLASRAGVWSAKHRKTAIWGWLGFVVLALGIGGAVGTKTLEHNQTGVGESGRADQAVADAAPEHAQEVVLIQSGQSTAADPAFRAVVVDTQRRLTALPGTQNFESPLAPANAGQISNDGHSALLRFQIAGNDSETENRVKPAVAAVAGVQQAHPGFTVGEFGDASTNQQLNKVVTDDFGKALKTSLPVTLIILLIAFGALVAAGVPLLLALTAVAATIGIIGPLSHVIGGVDNSINEVILLIGLAVGVDYSMFYLRREREEREAGRSEEAALAAAAATSGRAVLVSGFTVIIAMAGMYFAGTPTFESFATGTILVVAVALLGSLTVLPAILSWLGDRIEKGGVPIIKDQPWNAGESRTWAKILNPVLRHPGIALVLSAGLLILLALPTLRLHTANESVESLPQNVASIQTYNKIQEAFPGGGIPASVVVSSANGPTPQVRQGIARLGAEAKASPLFQPPITIDTFPDRSVTQVNIPIVGDGTDSKSNAALDELRDNIVPATIGAVPGVSADVTGFTAESRDFNDTTKSHLPIVFAFVLTAAFLLLLFTFRSIVIPIKAIILNLLSVGAAYGVLVWIFQDGHLQSFLGFHSTGAIISWMPLFLFVVLFGLSMDYHVFILTRIRESYDRGMSTDEAVAHGIKTTAGVVTSAAAVMIGVFAVFATLSLVFFKELGVGLGVAVLIDATLVRAILLPASMTLLGDWNWYLPRWLEWIPHVGPVGAPSLPPAAEAAPAGPRRFAPASGPAVDPEAQPEEVQHPR
ncbi:MAG: MMPL family transporter [Solirubrobacterales bacterium]